MKTTFKHYDVMKKDGKGRWQLVEQTRVLPEPQDRPAGVKYKPRFSVG